MPSVGPVPTESTLPAFLAARARRTPDWRLALYAGCGLLVCSALAVGRPPLWPVLLPAAVCVVAFGTWGICDRILEESAHAGARSAALRLLRGVAAVAGYAAGVTLLFMVLAVALGRWIS